MDYAIGYLLALIVLALGFLGIILAMVILEVNKRKFVVSFLLSLILVLFGGYYYFTVAQIERGVPSPNPLNNMLKTGAESLGLLPPAQIVTPEEAVQQ